MLIIETKDSYYEWITADRRTGEIIKTIVRNGYKDLEYVEARGEDMLRFIGEHFDVPQHMLSVNAMRWRGDWAMFIVDTLVLEAKELGFV